MSKHKILIIGSCVSRDILNYDADESFEIAGYYARSSFASAFTTIAIADNYTQHIASKFQAAIVKADLQKTLQSNLARLNFDLILVDLIDERFSLFSDKNGGLLTVSNELISGGFHVSADNENLIKSNSDEFYKLWEAGWDSFISIIRSMGRLNSVIIHETLWSATTQDGTGFEPSFNETKIATANAFLKRLYRRMSMDIPSEQFITPSSELLYGAVEHKWGISPFHYIDAYYYFMLEQLKSRAAFIYRARNLQPPPCKLMAGANPERMIEAFQRYAYESDCSHAQHLELRAFKGNAKSAKTESGLSFSFSDDRQLHQLRFTPSQLFLVNGVSVRFKISDWHSLSYIAIGYTSGEHYHHVKLERPTKDKWIDFSFGTGDLSFAIQNNWSKPAAAEISDIKIYIKGQPLLNGSTLELQEISCWRESNKSSVTTPALSGAGVDQDHSSARLPSDLMATLHEYLETYFPHSGTQVESFLSSGTCPLFENRNLSWGATQTLPDTLKDIASYKYSWHALHPATMFMMYERAHDSLSCAFSAREFINNWLERSHFSNDGDKNYIWHDPGVAERLISFLLMLDLAVKYSFDLRFIARLRQALFEHAKLLASEVRFDAPLDSLHHIHMAFQDAVLLAVALAMPELPCSRKWCDIAMERLGGLPSKTNSPENALMHSEQTKSYKASRNPIDDDLIISRLKKIYQQTTNYAKHQTVTSVNAT